MSRRLLGAALILIALAAAAPAQTSIPAREVTVGVFESNPFSYRTAAGVWEGLSVELWREATHDLHLVTKYRPGSRDELILAVAQGEVDVIISPMAMTAERERIVDFTHIYYTSGLGILVAPRTETSQWSEIARTFLSPASFLFFGGLASLFLLAGSAIWFVERKAKQTYFGDDPIRGIANGFWWSGVTFAGVGYGDKVPVTFVGRLIALTWMLASVLTVATFTATVTAKLAMSHLSEIRSREDLHGHLIGAVDGTVTPQYLRRQHLAAHVFPTLNDAIAALKSHKVDAVVHESTALQFATQKERQLVMIPDMIEPTNLAFVVGNGSTLRDALNVQILRITASPVWADMKSHYGVD